jgi:hypothetical protein
VPCVLPLVNRGFDIFRATPLWFFGLTPQRYGGRQGENKEETLFNLSFFLYT